MYLFTTPSSPRETGAPARSTGGPVVDAIRDGAQASGVGFDYLLATAQRESALDPGARAGTSTATGLFQFIEQTWLGVMKNAGPNLGLSSFADAITARPDGTYSVADAGTRQAILDLRRDPKIAATLAGALTQKNGESLAGALGREPTAGDLYAAHVLGARGAASLIAATQASPDRVAALDLPEAAAANRGLFYDRAGRPRTTAELYANLSTAAAAPPIAVPGETVSPVQAASAYTATAFGGTADLRSLFQTDKRQGAISEGVARLWQGRASTDAPARPAPSYFPRSEASGDDPAAGVAEPETVATIEPAAQPAAATPATGPALVNPPLPPRRPAEFAAAAADKSLTLKSLSLKSLSLYATRSGP